MKSSFIVVILSDTPEVPVPDNSYCGQIYYETKQTNWWLMKFVIVQDLNHLKKVLHNNLL